MKKYKEYSFLSEARGKTLSTVTTVLPNYPETEISDEVLFSFTDGRRILISSDYANIETPFLDTEDDSEISIMWADNHDFFCNIEDREPSSIMVHEPVVSFDLFFEEVSLLNGVNPHMYLVALSIGTPTRVFNVWKDLMTGFYLHGDFHYGKMNGLYTPEERWNDYDNPLIVRRIKHSVFCETESLLSEKIVSC